MVNDIVDTLRKIGALFGRTAKQISDDIKEHQDYKPTVAEEILRELEQGKHDRWKFRKTTGGID